MFLPSAINTSDMKPEKWIGITGLALLVIAFLIQPDLFYKSSPLVLLILAATGLLLSFRFKMAGSLLLVFAGAALWVQPLVLATIAGLIEVWKWWNSEA
jgi:hypothetical protein